MQAKTQKQVMALQNKAQKVADKQVILDANFSKSIYRIFTPWLAG
jgi:hypothetical protein